MDSVIKMPADKFSIGADNFDKYQPGYPHVIISYLQQTIGLKKRFRIADIGSGTGIFSELLLKNGYRVKAIEPNDEMRTASEKRLSRFSGFNSINGTAEETGLKDQSIDLITLTHAFKWFKPLAVKKEFYRILKNTGYTLLIWNIRQNNTPFLAAYSALTEKYNTDLKQTHRPAVSSIHTFFQPAHVISSEFHHSQLLNYEDLKGYLLTFHTVPLKTDPSYDTLMEELDQLFQQYSENNLVKMEYKTKLDLSKFPA